MRWLNPHLSNTRLHWLVFAAVALVLLAGMGLRFPWPADEPRFAQVAREMVESGQWLFPTRAGEYYPDKPPVFMWLIALVYSLLGNLKWSFLVPSALAAMGTLLLVHDLGRRLWNREVALFAVLVLVFTPQFLLQAKVAQIDAVVCFWITLGCYGFLRHFFAGPAWGWYFLSWAAMALGIMTKGVGFLPLLMLLPLGLWVRNEADASAKVWRWRVLAGVLVMAAVVACWLGPLLYQVQVQNTEALTAYRDNLLFKQTGERYVNAWGHIKPWHYFFTAAIPVVWFPLPLLLLLLIKPLVALFNSDARVRVLLVWVALVLLFFSFSPGKREVYILPALPMLALVVAVLWARVRAQPLAVKLSGFSQWVLVALVLGVLAFGLVAALAPQRLSARAQEYADMVAALAWPLVGLAALLLGLLAALRKTDLFVRLAALSVVGWLFVAALIWPLADPHRTPQAVMQAVERRLPADAELGLVAFKEQFVLFAQRPVTQFSYLAPLHEQERSAWAWVREQPNRFLMVPLNEAHVCFDMAQAQALGDAHRREWVLLGARAMLPVCEAPKKLRRYRYAPDPRGVLH